MDSDLYILAWQRVKELTNKELLCFVGSRNSVVRNLVIQEFHVRPSREVFEIATALIYEKVPRKRASGYLILGQLGSPDRFFRDESMPLVLHGLDSEKLITVQCSIAYAIGHLVPPVKFHPRITERLSRYVADGRKSLKVAAAFAISGLSLSGQLDQLLEKLLKDDDLEVQEWAQISLDALKERKEQQGIKVGVEKTGDHE